MEKAIEDIEELEKIEEEDEPMIGMSFDTDIEMFMYFKEYDQDKAMKAAIENVFPSTRHRWCLWHILKKIPEKLEGYKEYRDISNVLHCAVYDSQSSVKFEETWHHMIVEFELEGNEWLQGLYNERHRWFVEQYSNALKNKAQKEVEEDAQCSSHQLPCVTSYAMEKQIRDVYTISKFQEFQQELVGKMYCEFVNSMGCEYIVREDVKVDTWKKRTFFEVYCDKENGEIHCSCSRFQFRGILCRHAIMIMIRNDMEVLPEKFILRRWRKDVWRCHSKVKTSHELHSFTDEQKRYEKMCVSFAEVANVAAKDVESCNLVLNWIEKVRIDLPETIQCGGNDVTVVTGQGSCSNSVGIETHDVETVRDPVVKHRKGRPPCQRKKSTKFSKSKSAHSNANDGHVSDQVATMIPTFQNLQQSSVDKNMYPHGVMDYSNGLMNLHHITGDNVYPTATQNSSTTLLPAIKVGLAFLVMLAIMSFNGDVGY
ncbi:protein FAR1-RELATED SEQUENCE [Citrus sinensis]|uniref:Protein FAR1-RELATED SEQUENCE n=1 Tax=Citrus sinensis TaxID=2711 RepID=A0ACB8KDE6_CITSI|nr:protein FAR1-RELATED SEQUENCE [Citrus sinensis]